MFPQSPSCIEFLPPLSQTLLYASANRTEKTARNDNGSDLYLTTTCQYRCMGAVEVQPLSLLTTSLDGGEWSMES